MNFDDYQRKAVGTAIYPNQGDNLYYPALGLAGEAGEVADKVKRIHRGDYADRQDDSGFKAEIAKEIGDVLWYCANLAEDLGYTLQQIAEMNIYKLQCRKTKGTIIGDGDNR